MTIHEFNKKLSLMLKAFTKNDGFYRTGNLYRSIKFKTTYIDSQFDFKLDAVDYIKYIDNGNKGK